MLAAALLAAVLGPACAQPPSSPPAGRRHDARPRPRSCPVADAVLAGDAARVKAAVSRGGDLNCVGGGTRTPVAQALDAWVDKKDAASAEIARLLLSKGAKLSDPQRYFTVALNAVQDDLVMALKVPRAVVARDIFSLAYLRGDATKRNQKSRRQIELLFKKGAAVNATDPKTGDSLLHIAVRLKDVELIRMLKSRGADVRLKHPRNGQTPIQAAEAGLKTKSAEVFEGILGILREPGPGPAGRKR